ncbi:MAG: hypothetical protein HC801_04010, partial [Nitrospira sp.]|nr:hypothetical protein [Nitrospira sp.]
MRASVKSASKRKAKSSSLAGAIGNPFELPDGMWDRISQKAYELWEQRVAMKGMHSAIGSRQRKSSWKRIMKLASDQAAGIWTPRPPSLNAVLGRLESLSRKPAFTLQREMGLARAFRPYLGGGTARIVAPFAQETELAHLSLICDFYPEDGQMTLIEQLRDVITEHIPDEERRWLDPLKHSYLDLLELTSVPKAEEELTVRSLGDQTVFVVPGVESLKDAVVGQVILTRVVRDPDAGTSG